MRIQREFDVTWLNFLLNHPTIKPYIALEIKGDLEVSGILADHRNYVLGSDYGAILFHHLKPGLYERHSQVLPQGRGKWAIEFAHSCYRWMFENTDCEEIIVKSPRNNPRSKALAVRTGMTFQQTIPDAYLIDNKSVDADLYSLHKGMR